MSRLCIDLPPLAPDYSGAASALFDMGGIVVMHDASGCTGNYTGFDEPRWIGSRSAVFCSGLRRMDAVMGNDDKYIQRTLDAANFLKPSLIAYLGSPVPMVIGTDLEGMAAETQAESNIPSFGFHTTGECYYDKGASDVFVSLIKRFTKPRSVIGDGKKRVNLLGMIPLDVGNNGNCDRIKEYITGLNCDITACFAMGLDISQVENCSLADMSIVLSHSGLEAAKYLKVNYNIPYICGIPLGDGEIFRQRMEGKYIEKNNANAKILIIHEQVMANSLRYELNRKGMAADVGNMFKLRTELAYENDMELPNEKTIRKVLNSGKYSVVIADPELKKLIKNDGVDFVPLPHAAVSSKLHWDEYPNYLGEDITNLITNIERNE